MHKTQAVKSHTSHQKSQGAEKSQWLEMGIQPRLLGKPLGNFVLQIRGVLELF